MAKRPALRPDSNEAIGHRLSLIRIAYGKVQKHAREMSQQEIAGLCGMTKQAWNNSEAGRNRIGVDNALAIAARTGASLDYIYRGIPGAMAHALAVEIAKLEAPKASKSA